MADIERFPRVSPPWLRLERREEAGCVHALAQTVVDGFERAAHLRQLLIGRLDDSHR
jgi:hypothetical protein